MNAIRLLEAREIECRVAQISRKGDAVSILLYKDARCDMAILDETFGPMNWQRRHTRDNANCIVSIWDSEKQQWIEKEDTGTESNTEAAKGLASDSFKRACFNVGIGRELYTAPQIWIRKPNCEITGENGKYKCYDRFEVSEIGYNEHREINRLVIVNSKTGNVAFEYGAKKAGRVSPAKPAPAAPAEEPAQQPVQHQQSYNSGIGPQMATDQQKKYIIDHADDEDYQAIMTAYGADMETMTANQAAEEIAKIDKKNSMSVGCERCGKLITGIVLPNGQTMTASELIGKSKMTYGGVYCLDCMKILKKERDAKAG